MTTSFPLASHHQTTLGWLQARLINLLLRHEPASLRALFAAGPGLAAPAEEAWLRPYRELGALFVLRDELFEHILPRIVRHLSYAAPRTLTYTDLPTSGAIDWERTLDAAWAAQPGAVPLRFATRQRRRTFATPANLLAVVAVLEYREAIERVLRHAPPPASSPPLRHALQAMAEHCTRALARPYFSSLLPAARQVVQHDEGDHLATWLHHHLAPTENRAYADLLDWRSRSRQLRLPTMQRSATAAPPLETDPQHLDALYRLWVFYELAELLHSRGCLVHLDVSPGQRRLLFNRGVDDTTYSYTIGYTEQTADLNGGPLLGIWRTTPPPARVEQAGTCFWEEPGQLWQASFAATSVARSSLLGDMARHESSSGALLAALAPPGSPLAAGALVALDTPEHLPGRHLLGGLLRPTSDTASPAVQELLGALLDAAHHQIHMPRVPRCHGVFLDTLSDSLHSAAPHPLPDRQGQPLDDDPHDLLACPKPHIGPWRVDLVSRARHCCQDARLCHIVGQADAHKPMRPPRTADDLLKELHHIFQGNAAAEPEEETLLAITRQVETLSRRFAEIAGAYRNIELYYHRLRDLGMVRTLDLLGQPERESLALAVFLVEQLDSVKATDYSAPVIHIASVIELEVQRRVARCPDLTGAAFPYGRPTLGTLPFMLRHPERTEGDWERLRDYMAHHWRGNIDPDAPHEPITFEAFVRLLDDLKHLRNRAAHTHAVPRAGYSKLFRLACQGGPLRIGALNVLLLAWPLPDA